MIFLKLFKASAVILSISALALAAASLSRPLAVWLSLGVACRLRLTLSALSSAFPFPVFELVAIFSPALIFLFVRGILKSERREARLRFFTMLGVIFITASLYILTLAIPKSAGGITRLENYADTEISDSELIKSAEILLKVINEAAREEREDVPYEKMRDIFSHTYALILNKEITLPRVKEALIPRLMSQAGILALYSFPTGEIIINTEAPVYTIPFTVAHEYAHLVGADGEAEAGLAALIASLNSSSEYIRYSAALCALEYLLPHLLRVSEEKYEQIYAALPKTARQDLECAQEYYGRYKNGLIYKISDRLNSAYLDTSDKNGKYAYSRTAELIVGYLLSNNIA